MNILIKHINKNNTKLKINCTLTFDDAKYNKNTQHELNYQLISIREEIELNTYQHKSY